MILHPIVLVDENDRELGRATKEQAHKKPLLHRAFSLFIYGNGQLLLQQRAFDKYHSGGLWANTCCSHPRPNEKVEKAAERRLMEETGLLCDYVEEIFTFIYMHQFADDLFEHELDHVLISSLPEEIIFDFDAFDTDEIAAMEWMSYDDVLKKIEEEPEKFAPWFIIAAPRVIEYLRNEGL